VTLRKGYDSTDPKACPNDGEVYGGYNDGAEANNAAQQKALHPNALVFTIGRFTTSRADFYDTERGLLTIPQAVSLAKGNLSRNEFAGLYFSQSNWTAVQDALRAAGILGKVAIWVASYPGAGATVPAGAVGHQYEGSPGNSPGHYDVSVWVPYIKGLDPRKNRPVGFLPIMTTAVKLVTRRLNRRHRPLNHASRVLLEALVKAAHRVLDL
jgi:hypothetical protein